MLSSGITGVGVRLILGNRFQTKEACRQRHQQECAQQELVASQHAGEIKEIKYSLRILFRMNRALVTYSEIPAAEKEKILNANGDRADG
jgi:acetylglutamate kinase